MLLVSFAHGQDVLKFRAKSNSAVLIDDEGKWGEWTEKVEADNLIVINLEDRKITIYNDPIFVYDFIDNPEEQIIDEIKFLVVHAVNNSGDECQIRLGKGNSNSLGLIIIFKEYATYYDVEKL